MVKDPFDSMRQKIAGFSQLKMGWDTYGAGAPSKEAISAALLVLDKLEETDGSAVLLEWAVPTGDEGVLLQYLIEGTIYH